MAISKFWLDVFGEMVGVEGVLTAFQLLSTIKRTITLSISNPMSPFWSFYDNAFYENLICPLGITYNPCPEGCEGVVILKDLISRTFNYAEQNGYLKILIGCVWGEGGREMGAICPQSIFDY